MGAGGRGEGSLQWERISDVLGAEHRATVEPLGVSASGQRLRCGPPKHTPVHPLNLNLCVRVCFLRNLTSGPDEGQVLTSAYVVLISFSSLNGAPWRFLETGRPLSISSVWRGPGVSAFTAEPLTSSLSWRRALRIPTVSQSTDGTPWLLEPAKFRWSVKW
ncbi:unnamed protein product [Rangifer tarandus platyrhynchus]|uniref:Uncharacterized protein n=2 Tax=Rangifer tarandus platyrhynchus TaxID=3082113 RepID=A0ACB0F8Q1_RANTA|nr:unnamed protein product [Rangifer tarandus platyrhynchus]CAI9709294.1 unnamed protein product [Rangifer tarandus platyrhynchus]